MTLPDSPFNPISLRESSLGSGRRSFKGRIKPFTMSQLDLSLIYTITSIHMCPPLLTYNEDVNAK